MNKGILTIVLALILLACFFLPYFTIDTDKFSAFNIVFGNGKIQGADGSERFLWLLIPMGAIVLLFGGARTTPGFTYWLPLIGVLFIILRILIEGIARTSAGDAFDIILKTATYGFWISLVAAVLLPFTKRRI